MLIAKNARASIGSSGGGAGGVGGGTDTPFSYQAKLCDFGLAKFFDLDDTGRGAGFGDKKHTFVGTPSYIAPEIISGKEWSEGAMKEQ